jgi:hypothetical protein
MWDDQVVPTITEYITIPNKSPAFDPKWEAHGHMDRAVSLFEHGRARRFAALPGATLEVVRLPKRTPLILIDIPGDNDDTSCSTATSTNSRRWSAGSRATALGAQAR